MSDGTTQVVWTHRAEQRLYDQLHLTGGGSVVGRMAELDRKLAAAFRNMGTAIVLDSYTGYRPRPNEYVLRCDLRDARRRPHGTVIVKLTTADRDDALRGERDAWDSTRPPGFNGDAVFLSQAAVGDPDELHKLVAVVYQDAQRSATSAPLVPLEDVFLSCVQYGTPTPASVAAVVRALFAHLQQEFHRRMRRSDAIGVGIPLNPDGRGVRRELMDPRRIGLWTSEETPRTLRQHANNEIGYDTEYNDPVEFFATLNALYAAGGAAGRFAVTPRRGCAHGDLHGRNVLVAVRGEEAVSPAVYDYEHMHRDNLVGLDAVKLETELKVRAYGRLYPTREDFTELPPRDYLDGIIRVERALARGTVDVPPDAGFSAAERRLYDLVNAIRWADAALLANDPEGWQREYLLLLAAYGVGTVRFENHGPPERLAALLSAGYSAAAFVEVCRRRRTAAP